MSLEEQASKALSTARCSLVLGKDARSAFFATLALRLTPVVDWSVETMATDGKSLFYNPKFVNGLSPPELKGVVAHEVLHNALQHHVRRNQREPSRWNIACDCAVNPILVDAGFTLPRGRLMPNEGRFCNLPPGKSAEEYYALLGKDASGEASDPGGCGGVRDPGSQAEARQSHAEWQIAVAQAHQVAKLRGQLSGGLDRLVDAVLRPKLDWREVLRAFISRLARNDYAWSPPNRRFLHAGLYLPGLRSEELGEVVLAVDTSGSIGQEQLRRFAGETQGILDAYDCDLTVLYHDSKVKRVEHWQPCDGPLVLKPVGGGGTSHKPVFEWIDQQGISPACVVCLTDLYTDFPEHEPRFPVLWAVVGSNTVMPPFGVRVELGADS
jgi:predicted metal-dependent peptidase